MPRVDRAQRFLVNPHAWTDDPAVQKMSLEARGAYAALWLSGWDQKEPGVYLNDDRVLSQLARCSPEEWTRVRDMVLPAFVTERDMLVLPHFRVTYLKQNSDRDKSTKRQRRKRQRDRDVTHPVTRDFADGSGSGSGTGSDKEKEPTPTPPLRARRVPSIALSEPNQPPPPGVEPETWRAWFLHRVSIRKPLNELSATMCHKELSRFYEQGHDPDQIIQTAIASGWRGLFVPNHELNGRNGNGSQRR